jgi:hypothetical protein
VGEAGTMHRDCPEGTACFIRHLKEQKNISANEAIKLYSIQSGIPIKTLERWYWPGKEKPKKERKQFDALERIIKLVSQLSQDELKELKQFLLDMGEE